MAFRAGISCGSAGWRWAGLSLPQLLRAEAQSGTRRSHKAVIMIFLPGGPSHQDMFDLKMDAPSEIRGEFKPIPTNVPGIQISEHLPQLAQMMDKLHAHPLDGGLRHAARRFPVPDRPPVQGSAAGRLAVVRLGRVEAAGRARSGGAAVRRARAEDGPHGMGALRRAGLPRRGARALRAEQRRRHRGHDAQWRHARPARRSPRAARRASINSAATWTPAG